MTDMRGKSSMGGRLRIALRAGERIFVNGAVVRVDRKVSLELMNEAVFLLEQHVLKPEDANTPLRQLYYLIQVMLMDPSLHLKAKDVAVISVADQKKNYSNATVIASLIEVENSLRADRPLDALKRLRSLFPEEEARLAFSGVCERPAKDVA